MALFVDWKWSFYYKFKDFINSNIYQLNSFKYHSLRTLDTDIKDLKNKFIIVPIDKACNNFAFICKKFYLSLLDNELSCSTTYIKSKDNYNTIAKRILALNKRVNISNNKIILPYITINPKFHKTPVKFRYITCGFNTYMTQPGNLFANALKTIQTSINNVGFTWLIDNNKPVIDFVKKETITHIESYDFKDLFTSIPLLKLKEVLMSYFYDYINILDFDCDHWENLINFCLFNNYLFNGEHIFLQVIGIPQGCTFSSLLANLFLHFFEKNFTYIILSAFRYVDDIIIFNVENFDSVYSDIYPSELTLIKTNSSNSSSDFLDLLINIESDGVKIDLFDKRNTFNFHVNRLIFWNSNLSISIYRNIIISQISRIKRICNTDFNIHKNKLILKQYLFNNQIPSNFIRRYCADSQI